VGAPPLNLVLPPGNYPYNMKRPPGQRSLADMANERLNGGRRRDPLAEGMEGAATPDCLRPGAAGTETVGGLLAAPLIAARALQDKCK
jgi:hypothetical protein